MTKIFVICMAFLGTVLPGVSAADTYVSKSVAEAREKMGLPVGSSTSAGSLKDNGKGTVTDSKTHLMWQQGESGKLMNWDSAMAYCKKLSLAGYNDWRLPNIKELKSIIDVGETTAINKTYFPNADLSSPYYWSSTAGASYALDALNVDFRFGDSGNDDKGHLVNVRCVRGGH